MLITKLDGNWKLSNKSLTIARKNAPFFKENNSLDISIPGDVHTALINNNIIEDPYYADNEMKQLWVGKCDWKIERDFTFSKQKGKTLLVLTQVDTVSTVKLNGVEIGKTDNIHARYIIDVTNNLKNGDNTISFHFYSAEEEAIKRNKELAYPIPTSRYPVDSPHRNLVRKTQCHAGWDWGPCIMPIGIYESVKLVTVEQGYVKSWNCVPKLVDDRWLCKVEIEADIYENGTMLLELNINEKTFKKPIEVSIDKKLYDYTFYFEKDEVELWWPNGMGKQHLYPLGINFIGFEDKRMTAFRTMETKNNVTFGGKELTVSVNGCDVFAKGMNWIPQDVIPGRITTTNYIKLMSAMAECNMNMIRIWGGGHYENEAFYDACDRLGILIWHDLMFGCSTYPATDWFLSSVKDELEYQIPRLKSHPSIALWCGNNEDLGALTWYEESRKDRDRYVIDYDRLNEGVCGNTVRALDPDRIFWPSSPCAGPGDFSDNWHNDGSGDMHFWSVWHEGKPFEAYREIKPRFCSEFGFQSFPSKSTVDLYCPEDQLNLTSPVMEHHQKNPRGNSIILENFSRYFLFPNSLDKMLYLSQAQQAWAMQIAIDYWRSLRPYCMGSLIWQLNDVWPVASWSAIDYTGKWKLLMYHAKNFFAPISPITYREKDKLEVFATNDTTEAVEVQVSVKFALYKGGKIAQHVYNVKIPALSVLKVTSLDLKKYKEDEVYAYVKVSSKNIYRETTLFLTEPKKCKIQDPQLKYEVKESGKNNFIITLSAPIPAFWVSLDQGNIKGNFSDNMFSIRPSGNKQVIFTPEEKISLEEFKNKLQIQNLYWAGH